MTKPEIPASADNSAPKEARDPVRAAEMETVPNRPVASASTPEPGAASTHEAVDSLLVGMPKDSSREAAERKDLSDMTTSSIPKSSADASRSEAAAASKASQAEPRIETRVVEVRKAGFMPTLLGGVIAAGLGAGAAFYAIPHLPAAWQPVAPGDEAAQIEAARKAGAASGAEAGTQAGASAAKTALDEGRAAIVTEAGSAAEAAAAKALAGAAGASQTGPSAEEFSQLKSEISAGQSQIAALTSALDALRNAPLAATGEAGGAVDAAGLQALQSLVVQLRSQVEAQEGRINDLAARPAGDPGQAQEIAALAEQASRMQSELATAAASAQSEIAAAQAEAERVRQETAAIGRRAQLTAAQTSLQTALETGGNLSGGIAELRAAGVEVPAALNGDLSSLVDLQRNFDEAARKGLRAALKADSQGEGAFSAFGNFLRVQTGARSVEARDGTDPDAILSRAAEKVRSGDIAAALTEIAALPQPGQEAMAEWTAAATAWANARAALADLAPSAN